MNLQHTFPQTRPFPFSTRSWISDFFENKENTKASVPEQQTEQLSFDHEISRLKEDLILSWEALSILGENGRQRFDEFKRYPDGWYGGQGRKISKWSLANFERFVRRVPELKLVHPSIFMTLDGNIALGWEDANGKSCEVEFFPDKVEYFIESLNEESSVGLAGTFDLAEKFRGLFQ